MSETDVIAGGWVETAAGDNEWPGIDSRFRLIIVAALRSKQLLHGSRPRITPDPLRRRNTTIALEEVRRGLVTFTFTDGDQKVSQKVAGDDDGRAI